MSDKDYMKKVADMLKRDCEMRFYVDEDGDLDCNCPFCHVTDGGWMCCQITGQDDYTPIDWRITK